MKPAAFEYHAPDSADEVVKLLAELGDGAKVLAGGQSLIPVLALRLSVFEHLVDLRRVAELRGIERRDGAVWIGATTTQAAIGRSDLIGAAVPLLARATPLIGHFQIRNRGTIGGSLAHAESAAEYPAVARTLGASLHALSSRGTRVIPAADFFTGIWTTALEPDELLTGVTFADWDAGGGGTGFAIEEFARRAGDFAIAGATVAVQVTGSGQAARVTRCAVGLFGLGPAPLRAAAAEAAVTGSAVADLAGSGPAAEIGRAALAELASVPSDLHGSAGYRKRVGAAMVAAAWQRALAEATAGNGGAR